MLIGISGKKQAGKDTTGQLIGGTILDKKSKSNVKLVQFADKIKDIAAILLDVPKQNFEDEGFKKSVLPEKWWVYELIPNKSIIISEDQYKYLPDPLKEIYQLRKTTPRDLLQIIGTEFGRELIHPDLWVNVLINDYKNAPFGSNYIVTDVRFPNEVKAIQKAGGIVIRLERETGLNDNHISEIALDDFEDFDYVIKNDGNIVDLYEKIKEILLKEFIIDEN